jgi:hypothetical protein
MCHWVENFLSLLFYKVSVTGWINFSKQLECSLFCCFYISSKLISLPKLSLWLFAIFLLLYCYMKSMSSHCTICFHLGSHTCFLVVEMNLQFHLVYMVLNKCYLLPICIIRHFISNRNLHDFKTACQFMCHVLCEFYN